MNILVCGSGVIGSLPNGDPRQIFTFIKKEHTPNIYPRNYGQIKKKPL